MARAGTQGRRAGSSWVPNQHGAWAMLASPVVVGLVAAGARWVHLVLVPLWFVGYLWFHEASLWLKSRRKPRYRPPVVAYGVALVPLAVATAVGAPRLLWFAPVFGVLLGFGLVMAWRRHDRALSTGLAEVAAASLFTLVVMAAAGPLDWRRGWVLTAVQAAYLVGVLLYVKTMIRERGNRSYVIASVAFHAAATVAMAGVAWPLVAVVVGLTVRAWVGPRTSWTPKQVGVAELGWQALVLVVLLLTV